MSDAPRDADHLPELFAEVARVLAEQEGVEATLQRIVELAVETVPGAEHAGITQVHAKRRVTTVAGTSDLPDRIDAVQYETRQGPCLDALWEQEVVRIDDLAHTERWPQFAARASELGVRAMQCFRLFVEDDTTGALNLYSSSPHAFTEDSRRLGHAFAAHAALAWWHEEQARGLRDAVESRTVIGQAEGILMARRAVTADEAFALLRTASSHRNVKLRQVAEEVVRTGDLS